MVFNEILNIINKNIPLFALIIVVILIIIIFNFVMNLLKKYLLKKAKSKKQISNIKIFVRILNISFIITIILFAFFSYIGSWTSLGLVAGLLTAALGFALQRPITGLAAWVMVVLKRPFMIGDRIIIGNVKGEVYDITLTHICIDEIGGEIESDQRSGRNIMVPNYLLFENNIINYTLINDYILGEVIVSITYESDLEKAIKILEDSAIKFVNDYSKIIKREPNVRAKMDASCMNLKVRFFAPVNIMQEVSSNITKEIYHRIKKEKDVEIAYPHTEIIFKDKKLFKK